MKVRTRLIVTNIVMFFIMIWYNPLTAQVSNDSIIDYLSSLKKDLDLVSVSAVMVKGDKIVWEGAVGKANIEQDIDAKTSFEYQLGSVSKLFTGAALMKLYEDGKIDLDADINNYLPFPIRHPNFPETPITIRMLLTHTSSFADAQQLQYDLYVVGDSEMSIEELCIKYFIKNGEFYNDENWEEWEPGTKWDYCNWNFVLIGYIIEQVAQMPYHEYSQKYILDPLEMKSASWYLKDMDIENIVTLYDKREDGSLRAITHQNWPGVSDGTLRANLEEVSNFLIMIMNKGSFKGKQILKAEIIDEMLRPQSIKNLPAGYLKDMGLVWHIGALPNNNILYIHTGEPAGTIVAMMFNSETNSGFVTALTGIKFKSQEDGAKWVAYLVYLLQQSDSL